MEKTSWEAIKLFETLSENSQKFLSRGRQGLKGKGIHEENTNGGVQNQMTTTKRKLDILAEAMTSHNISLVQQIAQLKVCTICSHFDHTTETCCDDPLSKNMTKFFFFFLNH